MQMSYEFLSNGIRLIWGSGKSIILPDDLFLNSDMVTVTKHDSGKVDLIFGDESGEGITIETPLTHKELENMLYNYLSVEKPSDYTYELLSDRVRIYPRKGEGSADILYRFFRENPLIRAHPEEDTCSLVSSKLGEIKLPLSSSKCQEMLADVYNRLL